MSRYFPRPESAEPLPEIEIWRPWSNIKAQAYIDRESARNFETRISAGTTAATSMLGCLASCGVKLLSYADARKLSQLQLKLTQEEHDVTMKQATLTMEQTTAMHDAAMKQANAQLQFTQTATRGIWAATLGMSMGMFVLCLYGFVHVVRLLPWFPCFQNGGRLTPPTRSRRTAAGSAPMRGPGQIVNGQFFPPSMPPLPQQSQHGVEPVHISDGEASVGSSTIVIAA